MSKKGKPSKVKTAVKKVVHFLTCACDEADGYKK